jgi:gamma-glutamylcyclotransferase (GGCT)/AIG2-like uncharacterized protein YtfP
MNLFAYGTLIDPEIMREVSGELPRRQPAVLWDHERKTVRGKPYPGIRAKLGCSVPGVVYYDVSSDAWQRLDRFEGNLYVRTEISVVLPHGARVPAWTYLVAPTFHHELSNEEWNYEEFLRSGKRTFRGQYEGFREIE